MRALGIDLATEPKKTGVVILDVDEAGRAVAHRIDATPNDDLLVALAREVDVIGVSFWRSGSRPDRPTHSGFQVSNSMLSPPMNQITSKASSASLGTLVL